MFLSQFSPISEAPPDHRMMRVWGFGCLGRVFCLSDHGLGLRVSGWLVRGMGCLLCLARVMPVLTLMRVGFLPSRLLSPWGWGATHPLPVVVLRVCLGAITAGRLFSLLPGSAGPILSLEVVRDVLTSSRTANAFCTPCAGASASDMHWLGYCASLMLSFLPTRTARSTNIKEKDSDVVTDGTVGWRRRKNVFAVGVLVILEQVAEQRPALAEDPRNLHPKEHVLEVARKKSKKHRKTCHWGPFIWGLLKCCQTTGTSWEDDVVDESSEEATGTMPPLPPAPWFSKTRTSKHTEMHRGRVCTANSCQLQLLM